MEVGALADTNRPSVVLAPLAGRQVRVVVHDVVLVVHELGEDRVVARDASWVSELGRGDTRVSVLCSPDVAPDPVTHLQDTATWAHPQLVAEAVPVNTNHDLCVRRHA